MIVERELKLAASPSFSLPSFDAVLDGATASPPEGVRLETTYYDTPELRLAGWDCALRFRKGEGWTVKLPSTSGPQGELARPEITVPGEAFKVPDAARNLVLAYIRRSPLQEIATLSTMRTRVRLHDASGRLIAEVVDDDVSVVKGIKVVSRHRQLEIELGEAADDRALAVLHRHLHESGAGEPETTSKLAMALASRMPVKPEIVVPDLGDAPTVGELVRHAIAENVVRLFRHDPGIRLGSDPEDIHKARVATRRLRSQLKTFGPLLERDWRKRLREELKWLAGALGDVRDRQVMARRFRELGRDVLEGDQRHLNDLAQRAIVESEEARARLVLDMRAERYLDLLERLVQAARTPAFAGDVQQDALKAAMPLVRREWRRVRKLVNALPRKPSAPELHRVRIQAKQARYAAEAMQPVVGQPAERFAEAAAALQDVLGEHQDSITAQRWLHEAGHGDEAFVAGALYVLEGEAASEVRGRWEKVWKSLRRRKIRRWMMI